MLLRAVWKSMAERRQRVALALAALTIAATLATALLGLYSDIEGKLHGQFRGYGANVILSPAGGSQTLPLEALAAADKYGAAAPFLYSIQTVNGEAVVLAGVDFKRLEPLSSYWQVRGRRHPLAEECLAGERVAERFQIDPGSRIEIGHHHYRVAGVIATGAAEDSEIFLPIEDVAEMARLNRVASLIAVRVEGAHVEQARAALAAALPYAEARVLRAVAESEANVVLKVRDTLLGLTLLILAIVMLCVMNSFAAVVYQRRKEIGILKAIGGGDARIAGLFASEILLVALAGSIAGFGLGWVLARWLGLQIFHQPIQMSWQVLPAVTGITVLVALAAMAVPLRRIHRIEPAVTLRGE
jgi:putative ABC transport system permease protein